MSSLLSTLHSAGRALDAFQQAMAVVQNNVTNASTPGYVTQTPLIHTSSVGEDGTTVSVESARNRFAEQSVWSRNETLGSATAQASSLSALQSVFDVSGKSGIPAALSSLYSAFSAWSTSPADGTSQQQVINAARTVAQSFQSAASDINKIRANTDQKLSDTVNQINDLSAHIAGINAQIREDASAAKDGGLQADLYNTLEKLSNLASTSVQVEGDGTVTVLMGGQTPLVIGTTQSKLQVTYTGSAGVPPPLPDAHVTAGTRDVTSIVSNGQFAALLQFRNETLPSVIGNGTQQGSFNQLAQSVADQVNSLLESGQTGSGSSGVPLFTYSGGATLGGDNANLNTAGAKYLQGTSGSQTFRFDITDATGAQHNVVASFPAQAGGYTLGDALGSLTSQLSSYGIVASVDPKGHLQFTGPVSFTVSDSNSAATPITGALTSYGSPAGASDGSGSYDPKSPTYVAATLSVSPGITGSQLASSTPGGAANGVASQLAQLANATNSNLQTSFTSFYSNIASDIGAQASSASLNQQTQTQLLTQAQNMRAQVSGVSLNEQAAQLVQLQQAYQASAQLIQIIASTSNYLMQVMQST